KDRIIFATKEDHETPSSAELVADDPDDPYEEQGLILPNGDINWNCPCLGGMASGPCGEQFKSAFSCFHYSTEEIKGSDCVDQFRAMQECEEKEKSSKDLEAAPVEASAAKEEKGSS
ncbi:PREDICTED: mitochondrial intermembrane space import and assembly protein 40, partial [Buceros rhinoceros silvestris]|uniref:mitochondrial intermembrane space import and assembly protein 40 n=1 Tax=Buceros rhinoceros silvestris TaxID=175836 RepID=UPI0005293FDC